VIGFALDAVAVVNLPQGLHAASGVLEGLTEYEFRVVLFLVGFGLILTTLPWSRWISSRGRAGSGDHVHGNFASSGRQAIGGNVLGDAVAGDKNQYFVAGDSAHPLEVEVEVVRSLYFPRVYPRQKPKPSVGGDLELGFVARLAVELLLTNHSQTARCLKIPQTADVEAQVDGWGTRERPFEYCAVVSGGSQQSAPIELPFGETSVKLFFDSYWSRKIPEILLRSVYFLRLRFIGAIERRIQIDPVNLLMPQAPDPGTPPPL
jgi:hypothetical protein